MRVLWSHQRKITAVQVYAPTDDADEEEIDEFYQQLKGFMKEIPTQDMRVLMGNWNAKVGKVSDGWNHVMGQHGIGKCNERGERQFAK